MKIKTESIITSSDIPKLDLARSSEDKDKLSKLILQKNLNDFGSLKELFNDIHTSFQNNLKYFIIIILKVIVFYIEIRTMSRLEKF